MFVLILLSFVIAVSVKAPVLESIVIDSAKDPVGKLKNSYARMIWKDAIKEKDVTKRFYIFKRVLDYDQNFMKVYTELCKSSKEYINSELQLKEFLALIRSGVERFQNVELTNCYLEVLMELSRYDEAIDFLKREYTKSLDNELGKEYLAKLKKLQDQKNVLDITKAVEAYYQKNKTYPGDILILLSEGYLNILPEEPYGGQYFIGTQGQVRSTSEVEKLGR